MGIWESFFSADVIKRNTPDVTPVTDACQKSYVYCRDSTSAVARQAHVYLSDDQVRHNVDRLAKYGAIYIARSYGGGPIIDIVTKSLQEKKIDPHKKRIDELEAKVAKLEEKLSAKKRVEQSAVSRATALPNSQQEIDQRLVDAVNLFMTEQFVGTKLFDDLMNPATFKTNKKGKFPV